MLKHQNKDNKLPAAVQKIPCISQVTYFWFLLFIFILQFKESKQLTIDIRLFIRNFLYILDDFKLVVINQYFHSFLVMYLFLFVVIIDIKKSKPKHNVDYIFIKFII